MNAGPHRVTPKAIAVWFINHADRNAGEAITHLKVQKLAYYADAWYLANFDKPLIEEEFQAWTHGPVSLSIWSKYKGSNWNALEPERNIRVHDDISSFLSAVYDEYGQFSASKLEELTHSEYPWRLTRGNLPLEAACDKGISKIVTRNYYAERLGKPPVETI
jgi:uncharacterized phage-associated protein